MEWRFLSWEGPRRVLLGYSFITGVRFQLSRTRSVKFRSEGKAKNHLFSEHFFCFLSLISRMLLITLYSWNVSLVQNQNPSMPFRNSWWQTEELRGHGLSLLLTCMFLVLPWWQHAAHFLWLWRANCAQGGLARSGSGNGEIWAKRSSCSRNHKHCYHLYWLLGMFYKRNHEVSLLGKIRISNKVLHKIFNWLEVKG